MTLETPNPTVWEIHEVHMSKTIWSEFVALQPLPSQLLEIIKKGGPFAKEAYKLFLASEASNCIKLVEIVESGRQPMTTWAAREILKMKPHFVNIIPILKNVRSLRTQAARLILKSKPSAKTLWLVFDMVRPLRAEAWRLICRWPAKQVFDDAESLWKQPKMIARLVNHYLRRGTAQDWLTLLSEKRLSKWHDEIGKKLLSCTDECMLITLIKSGCSSKLEAAHRLLRQKPTAHALFYLILNVPEVQEAAWKRFKRIHSEIFDDSYIKVILEKVERYAEEAAAILLQRKKANEIDVRSIVTCVPTQAHAAAVALLRRKKLEYNTLLTIVRYVPKLQKQAWHRLTGMDLHRHHFLQFIKEVPTQAANVETALAKMEKRQDLFAKLPL